MTRSEAIQEIRAIERHCRGPLNPDAAKVRDAMLREGNEEGARAEDAAGRPGCGADFNEIIIAGPFDGAVHEYSCAQCGVEGEYRAPRYDIDAEVPAP